MIKATKNRTFRLDPRVLDQAVELSPYGVKASVIIRKLLVMYCNDKDLREAVQCATGQTFKALTSEVVGEKS